MNAVDSFKEKEGRLRITLSQKDIDGKLFTKSFRDCTLINHPEFQLQTDGVVSLEFEGKQAI
jgi:hypothetical protein